MTWTTTINTKVMNERGVLHVTIQGTLGGASDPSPVIDLHDWPVFSIQIRVISGTAPTGEQIQASNDGGSNYANYGSALATASGIFVPTQLAPFDALRLVPTGGDATTVIKIDAIANRNW